MTIPEPFRSRGPRQGDDSRSASSSEQPLAAQRSPWSDFDQAWVMTVELIAATLTWGGIGWLLDRWLSTDPWLMVLGFVIGNAAGIYLVWLRSSAGERQTDDRGAARAGSEREGNGSGSDPAAPRGSG